MQRVCPSTLCVTMGTLSHNAEYGSFVNAHKQGFPHTADTCASSSSETCQQKKLMYEYNECLHCYWKQIPS